MKLSNSIMKIKRKVLNQYTAALIVGFSHLSVSTAMLWLTVAITKLRSSGDEPQMSENDSISLVTWPIVGIMISSVVNIIVQDRKGRKFLMVSGQTFIVSGWLISAFTSTHVWWCLARALKGLGCGYVLTSGYVYVAEISEDHVRGVVECILQLMCHCGNVFLFSMSPIVSLQTLTICLFLISIISLLLLLLLPESPYYLISKEKPDRAETALMVIRGKTEPSDVADEINKIVKTVEEDRANRGTFRDLFVTRSNVKPFLLSAILIIICCLHGFAVIGSYVTVIFAETGCGIDENLAGLVMSSILLAMSLIASPFIDRVGRLPILMTSFTGCSLGLSSMAIHFYLKEYTSLETNWLPLPSLGIYYVSYSMGIGLVSWTVVSELLPLRIKAPGAAVVMLISGLSHYGCVEIYRQMRSFGNHVVFLSYAFICFLGVLFVGFILPETKQMSFIEIDRTINCAKSKTDITTKEHSTRM